MAHYGIADWYVKTIYDVFNNEIQFEWSAGSANDAGIRYPHRITYAQGHREVLFEYESRPDRIEDRRGGIRRSRSQRLREIQVKVNGAIHHRLVMNYSQSPVSGQTLLTSVQRFGSGCNAGLSSRPTVSESCAALPPMEFKYSDTGLISASNRWTSTGQVTGPEDTPDWYAPPGATLSTGDPYAKDAVTQFADINGDGLLDIVADRQSSRDGSLMGDTAIGGQNDPTLDPVVYINNGGVGGPNGAAGWDEPVWDGVVPQNESARWTDRLRQLTFDLPTIRVKTVRSHDMPFPSIDSDEPTNDAFLGTVVLGTCISSGDELPSVQFESNTGSVQFAGTTRTGGLQFDSTAWHNTPQGTAGLDWTDHIPRAGYVPPNQVKTSVIRPWPHFQFVDINADGRADMVMSVHLSGFNLSLVSCESPTLRAPGSEVWIPGADVKVAFINNGEGWNRDDARNPNDGKIAESLPLFGIVAFESPDLAYREIRQSGGYLDRPSLLTGAQEQVESPCNDYGLAGGRDQRVNRYTISWDFCITTFDLAPVFEDLNGDGLPDIVVTETLNPDALFHNYLSFGNTPIQPVHRSSTIKSVAYVQNTNATPTTNGQWIRSPAFFPPLPHAHVIQLPGDSPAGPVWPGSAGNYGHPQTYNVDKGVRFVDLNRDGLSDIVFSPGGLAALSVGGFNMPAEFDGNGGVFINRGAKSGSGEAVWSAWCASSAVGSNIDTCADEAGRYRIPFSFAWFSRQYLEPGDEAKYPDNPFAIGISFVDLNGDGWLDVLEQETASQTARPPRAWIHQPGRLKTNGSPDSVWVEKPEFKPSIVNMYQDDSSCGGSPCAARTGYGVVDVNADGVADIVGSNRAFPSKQSYVSNPASARDQLLIEYRNGQGLQVQLEYVSALQQRDAQLEQRASAHSIAAFQTTNTSDDHLAEPIGVPQAAPFETWPVVDDVSSWSSKAVLRKKMVTTANMPTAATTYHYGDPRRCSEHKTDLGFRIVKETRHDDSWMETLFYQKHGRTGKIAEQIVYKDATNAPIRSSFEVWRLVEPASLEGGWASSAGETFDTAFIGRVESRRSRNEYGATVGATTGYESVTRYQYDDAHGYNFVETIFEDDPGRQLRTERHPVAVDLAHNLVMRVGSVQQYANMPNDARLLSQQNFLYWSSGAGLKPTRVEALDRARDGSQPGRWDVTELQYDGFGNLVSKTLIAEAGGTNLTTSYCYDGDSNCQTLVGDAGQDSHSLLQGTQDALGQWQISQVHPIFPVPTKTSSTYTDVPTIQHGYDSFGRRIQSSHVAKNGSWSVLMESTVYWDAPTSGIPIPGPSERYAPFHVSTKYSDPYLTKATSTIEVAGGGGGPILSLALLWTNGTTASVVAKESKIDAILRQVRTSDGYSCGSTAYMANGDYGATIAACFNTPSTSKDWTTTSLDSLGRPVLVQKPNTPGLEVARYSAEGIWVYGSGPDPVPHDVVLRKNANGGLKETVLAGSLPVKVRECNAPLLSPTLDSLTGVTCGGPQSSSPDETKLYYEPTGELRQVEDPTTPGDCGVLGPCIGWNQRLAYDYDTLGRVTRIFDPDAAVSTVSYDVFGNISKTRDARGYEVNHLYDALNRPTRIEVINETPTVFSYLAGQLQTFKVADGAIEKQFSYDLLGRVSRTQWKVDNKNLLMDYEYDYLNRPKKTIYPTLLNGYKDTIVYEYQGAFLKKVCDIGLSGGTCALSQANPIVSDITYDSLGRPSSMALPGGNRTFAYDRLSPRLTSDAFASTAGSAHNAQFLYQSASGIAAYDGLQNLTRVAAIFGSGSNSSPTYSMEYTYDARNRIDTWNLNGTIKDFNYDSRGNMILHAGDPQVFGPPNTVNSGAHAIQSRVSGGSTYAYEYDGSGNLMKTTKTTGGNSTTTWSRFDSRGRLDCVGSGLNVCNVLSVTYNGIGERVKEIGSGTKTFLYAGPGFRFNPTSAGGGQEYWIEIEALGQRVGYKYVLGGELRTTEMFPPGGSIPEPLVWILILIPVGLGVGLVVTIVSGIVIAPSPGRAAASLGLVFVAALVPVQAWAGGGSLPPPVSGYAVYRWVLSDQVGSSLVEIDNNGAVVSRTANEPFGKPISSLQTGTSGTSGRSYYAGHDRQSDSGLVYMNARWMDPGSGTFVSVDPVVEDAFDPQAYIAYSYVKNNPISLTDPTGACSSEDPCDMVSWTQSGDRVYTASTNSDEAANAIWLSPIDVGVPPSSAGSSGSSGSSGSGIGAGASVGSGTISVFWSTAPQGGAQSGESQAGGPIVDSTAQAFGHYFGGSGEDATLGPESREAIIDSPDQQGRAERIRTGATSNIEQGKYGVNVIREKIFIGDTPVLYRTACSAGTCTTTFTSAGDGFWDPVVDVDGPGPKGELPGGTPYHFEPFSWQMTFPDPRNRE